MLYFWLGLLLAVIIVPLIVRAFSLRSTLLERWRERPPKPLTEFDLAALFHWQARNLAIMVLFIVVGLADALMTYLRLLTGSLPVVLWVVFLFLGVTGLVHHLSVRCPRCGMPIGLQVNLLLPERCQRCRVAFRSLKHRD